LLHDELPGVEGAIDDEDYDRDEYAEQVFILANRLI
jgi:hypothetical protein